MIRDVKILKFKNYDFDEFVAKYREICAQPMRMIPPKILTIEDDMLEYGHSVGYIDDVDYHEEKRQLNKKIKDSLRPNPRRALKSDDKIIWKATYVIHNFLYRCISKGQNSATMSTKLLKKVIGGDYVPILDTLHKLGHITSTRIYTPQKQSITYYLNTEMETEITITKNQTIIKYIDKTKEALASYLHDIAKKFEDKYGTAFKDNYLRSLNLIKIADTQGLKRHIASETKKNPNKEIYYGYTYKTISKGKYPIYGVDKSNRVYHILTSIEREMKQYLNIKYQLDIKNSHPLLFNYLILYQRGVDAIFSSNIFSFLINYFNKNDESLIYTHYDGKYLREILNNSNIENGHVAKLADDELEYMFKTSTGQFWEEFLINHSDMDRHEIKKKLFSEIFYSRTGDKWWKRFAKEFKVKYPTVYTLINEWKDPFEHEQLIAYMKREQIEVDDDPSTALSAAMMTLESKIFRDILTSLYKKRIKAVHIHDAIVIPDAKSTRSTQAEPIIEVMQKCYHKYGLSPSIDVK